MYHKRGVGFPVENNLRIFILCTVFATVFSTRNTKLMCVHSSSKHQQQTSCNGERKSFVVQNYAPAFSKFGRNIIFIEKRKKIFT
jgi:hypothetical protein